MHTENLIDLIIKEDNNFLMSSNFSMSTTELVPFDMNYTLFIFNRMLNGFDIRKIKIHILRLTVYDKIKDQYDWHVKDEW